MAKPAFSSDRVFSRHCSAFTDGYDTGEAQMRALPEESCSMGHREHAEAAMDNSTTTHGTRPEVVLLCAELTRQYRAWE